MYMYSVIHPSKSILFSTTTTLLPSLSPRDIRSSEEDEIQRESEESSVKMMEARHVQLQKNNRSGHPFNRAGKRITDVS